MYCPECKTEFREGFTHCVECDAELVDQLPTEPEPEYVDLVTVFEGDSATATVVSGRLNSAGLEAKIKDEGIQSVFPNLGPAEVQVRAEEEAQALEILNAAPQDDEETTAKES